MTDVESKKNEVNGTESLTNNMTDSSEADPCMLKSNLRKNEGKFSSWLTENREKFSSVTGLSPRGAYISWFVLFVLFVCIVSLVVLAFLWPRVPHKYKFPKCSRPECLRAAAQIQESIDQSYTPCSNFWGYACGRWLTKNPLPADKSIWNIEEQLKENEITLTRDLISSLKPEALRTGSVELKMKKLYDSCMQFEILKGEDVRSLKEIIYNLNGWYILRSFNKYDFDVELVLTQLHAKYRVSPFFQISVEPNGHVSGQNIIRIAPSGLGLPSKDYYYIAEAKKIQDAYIEMIRDTVMNMDTTLARAEEFAKNMFFYEQRIAYITPNISSLRDPIAVNNVMTLAELKDAINNIPFIDILAATYPDSNISDQTEVVVSSLEYLTRVSQIMSTTDTNSLNGYLVWTLVRNFLPYLSTDFTKVLDKFHSELYGIQEPKSRWKICSEIVNDVMGLAVASLEKENYPLTDYSVQVVNETFLNLITVARKKIEHLRLNYPDLYRQLDQKLATLNLQIGPPNNVLRGQYLKSHYQSLQVLKSDFFQNILYSLQFHRKLEGDALNEKFVIMKNFISLPRRFIKPLFFEADFPRSYTYGHLGFELAKSVIGSIIPYGSFWTARRLLLTKFHMTVNNSRDLAFTPQQCLSSKISMDVNTTDIDIKYEIALELWKKLAAIDLAYESLTAKITKEAHVHIPSLEDFEDNAIYFLSVAQMHCTHMTTQRKLYQKLVDISLSNEQLISLAWQQIQHFSESFDCSFNEGAQCPLWF